MKMLPHPTPFAVARVLKHVYFFMFLVFFLSVEGAKVLREDSPEVRLHNREGCVCGGSNGRRAQRPAHQRVDAGGWCAGAG